MFPELLTLNLPVIGEFTITSFGVMMAIAFLVGYHVIRRQVRETDPGSDLASDILLGALVGGIVGAKVYYVLLYWHLTARDPFGMLFARGGLVWYGGLIGGAIGVIYMARRRGVRLTRVMDITAPALALSYSIGRIGCFLVGDDYGRPTDSWVGLAFPKGIPPTTAGDLRRSFGVSIPDSVPDASVLAVHPTQLYEVTLAFLIFLVLWRLRLQRRAAGWLFAVWMVLAGTERAFVEIFRAKDDRFFGPLTLAQVLSLALIGLGLVFMRRLADSGTEPAAS
ncbi:MAG: prolipoprotein diacylglyceryl transferase [Gemmatimonadota bacterium]